MPTHLRRDFPLRRPLSLSILVASTLAVLVAAPGSSRSDLAGPPSPCDLAVSSRPVGQADAFGSRVYRGGAGSTLRPAKAGALKWTAFSADAYDEARRSGEPFVIAFGAEWCAPCKEMERRTFRDPDVLAASRGFTFLSVDMTEKDRITQLILESFKVVAAPTMLFFGPDGKEWRRQGGFISPGDFAKLLDKSRKARAGKPASQGLEGQGA